MLEGTEMPHMRFETNFKSTAPLNLRTNLRLWVSHHMLCLEEKENTLVPYKYTSRVNVHQHGKKGKTLHQLLLRTRIMDSCISAGRPSGNESGFLSS